MLVGRSVLGQETESLWLGNKSCAILWKRETNGEN